LLLSGCALGFCRAHPSSSYLASAVVQISVGGFASGNAVPMAIAGVTAVTFGTAWAFLGFPLLKD
jgi:hypothetical protein